MPLPLSISGRKMSVSEGNAILQEIDASHRKTALADFRWQSIDFVDALRKAEDDLPLSSHPYYKMAVPAQQSAGTASFSIFGFWGNQQGGRMLFQEN